MNFEEYKKHHNKFNETLNTSPFFYFLKLAEEVGEVMEITAAIGGSKRKIAKLGGTENIKNKLVEELGDVICVALTCAYQYDITPEELFAANAEKLIERMAAKKEEATAPVNHFKSRARNSVNSDCPGY